MPARAESFPLHHRPGRRILKPVLGWAFVATVLAVIRRYTRHPSLPRMSEQWMLSHQSDFNRDEY
jgi:hypothetical protein